MKNDVLEYIGLDLDKIPQELSNIEPIHFSDFSNSNTYKVYEYVSVHDLEILITPLDRTADLRERYKLARPIYSYIQAEDAKLKQIFNEVLESASVKEIQKLEKLQEKLKDIPYFVKYDKNYLWQIYYSKEDNKYFMLFPANEGETSVLFYIIKKKLEKEDTKIFVPINKMDYKGILLNSMQINDIENYIWLFTNEWPNIYEVSNKYLYVTGHTKINKLFNSYYRNVFDKKEEAEKFYMLLKAMFILTTETNYKYNFEPYINEKGNLELKYVNENFELSNINEKDNEKNHLELSDEDIIITTANLADFVDREVERQKIRKKNLEEEIKYNEKLLKDLKEYVKKQNDIYVMQEKQIVMFLDCKKSFFKKISYFFKTKKFVMHKLEDRIEDDLKDSTSKKLEIELNGSYTLKELINAFNAANEVEIKARSIRGDIRALKLKKENYARKIENAKKYIDEIESHKKSIFEFWKFSNKDELPALSEAENTQNNDKNLNKSIDKDFLGVKADSLQRQKLSNDEINALYLFYKIPDAFNCISSDEKLKNILENLKNKTSKRSLNNIIDDYTPVKKIKSKEHRENERNVLKVLKINEYTTIDEFKDRLKHFKKVLKSAYNKIYALTDMSVYIKKSDAQNEFVLGDINPENLIEGDVNSEQGSKTIKSAIKENKNDDKQEANKLIELIKVDLTNKEHALYMTNIVFFDNQNKTLPIGMDLSSKVVIKLDKVNKKFSKKQEFYLIDKIDDFKVENKKINIYE